MLADQQAGTTDEQLVLLCQHGRSAAFRQLYRRYQQRVRATLYQLCGSEMLEDLVQEVFLKVWQGLPQLRQTSQFSTWLYRISWNVAIDRRRQLAKQRREKASTVAESYASLDQMLSHSQNPSDLMHLHYQDLVSRALQTLSLEHRVVLVLHDLEDLPQKEVAKVLKLPLGTVKSRLFYARKAVREFLQQQGVL